MTAQERNRCLSHQGPNPLPNEDFDPQSFRAYEDTLPSIPEAHQAYHSTHLLEASPRPTRLPFSVSPIARLPPELRELIYTFVLKFTPTIGTSTSGTSPSGRKDRQVNRQNIRDNTPQWLFDHKRLLNRGFNGNIWPPDSLCQHQTALTATFSPSNFRRTHSKLALPFVCRQLYRESYHVYYSVNRFSFASISELLAFLRHIGPDRRAQLASVRLIAESMSPPFAIGTSEKFENAKKAVGLLKECESLRELHVQMEYDDESFLNVLKELGHLKRLETVEIRSRFEPGRTWVGDRSGVQHRERVLREMEAVSAFLRGPKV